MRIDISHFVLETPRYANDQIVDESLDGPKSSHVLARAMMQLDIDNLFWGMWKTDWKMGQVFDKFA